MDKSLFSKKSISGFNTPDDLNDYIRVANPGLWIILTAMIVFLVGVCIWGIFGRIESKIEVPIQVDDGVAVCSVEDREQLVEIEEGMTVEIGNYSGKVLSVDFGQGTVTAGVPAPDGNYTGDIVKKEIAPISFITN